MARWHTLASVAVIVGCSSPTRPATLEYPELDVPVYVPTYNAPDAVPITTQQPSCGGDSQTFTRSQSEAILLIDRSGSMTAPINENGPDAGVSVVGPSKWMALSQTLNTVLPEIQANVAMGLLEFPRVATGSSLTPSVACSMAPGLDVTPAFNSAISILQQINAYLPDGGTPTYAALSNIAAYYQSEPDMVGSRYVILATDGAPNCNPMDPTTCRCSDVAAYCNNPSNTFAAYNCLDEARTVNEISALYAMGIPTYVIGLPGTENFADVLSAMAVAGGRPRTGATTAYYSIQSAQDLATQFSSIATGLVACTFTLTTAAPDPDLVAVRFNGTDIPKDTTHINGWDWADSTYQVINFYGMACGEIQIASGGDTINVVFGCPSNAPP